MVTMKRWILPSLALLSRFAGAQDSIPVRDVGPIDATSAVTVGFLYGIRELSDGRLLVNDAARRQLLLLDRSLAVVKVIADSTTGAADSYGARPTGIIPYLADSTLLIDLGARAFLVIDPAGTVARVMSPPRPADVGFMWNPSLGTPTFDARGRIVYRTWLMPRFQPPEAGKPFVPPEMPDSAPVLRGDFDARSVDTLAWVRIPRTRIASTPLGNGGVRLSAKINPMATMDDWTMLSDGAIAILRGHDYHVDWIEPDGRRWSSPKLPFDWRRVSDEEKVTIIDSTKKALERQGVVGSFAMTIASGHGGAGAAGHSMTIVPVRPSDGAPPPKSSSNPEPVTGSQRPEVVAPEDLPDYVPPILRSGTMKTAPDGRIWVLPSTSSQSGRGLVYDVIDRQGRLVERVRLPAGRALEGFGADGVVYLTSNDPSGKKLERARLKGGNGV
jgi:hypothetical protein